MPSWVRKGLQIYKYIYIYILYLYTVFIYCIYKVFYCQLESPSEYYYIIFPVKYHDEGVGACGSNPYY